jgi:predicted nucleic acid-binding protein
MPSDVAADTSFLYALFDRDDEYHATARENAGSGRYSYLTTLAVITETVHLLHSQRVELALNFLRWIRRGAVLIVDLAPDDLDRTIEVMEKYADLPADFADATIMAISERLRLNRVATFDHDFDVYRYLDRGRFRNVLR